ASTARSMNRFCCASAYSVDGVTRYAARTPRSAARRLSTSSKSACIANASEDADRDMGRNETPCAASASAVARPVDPVAPVTRMSGAVGMSSPSELRVTEPGREGARPVFVEFGDAGGHDEVAQLAAGHEALHAGVLGAGALRGESRDAGETGAEGVADGGDHRDRLCVHLDEEQH